MNTIVVAFSGGVASSAAIPRLAAAHTADIVTVTLDVGQGEELGALRARALSCGAVRAHAIDARDELAREFLLPSLEGSALGDGYYPPLSELVYPMVARKLVEIARIEGTRSVAHGTTSDVLDDGIRAIDSSMEILTPSGLPGSETRIDQNLWGRMVSWPAGDAPPAPARPRIAMPSEPAYLAILFDRGVPVSLNGVPMSPVELLESLTLIAGRHGVGRLEADGEGRRVVYDAPAVVVLHAARAAAGEREGVVRLSVLNGRYTVLAPLDPHPHVVNHA